MNRNLIIPVTALLLTFSLTGCFKKRSDATGPGSVSASHLIGGGTPSPILTDLSKLQVGVGTRDFNQIQMTMSQLTGIDHRNSAVQSAFASVTSALPSNNDIKTLSGPNIVSITKLAATYCDQIVSGGGSLRSTTFPGINFGSGPNAITTAVRDQLLTSLLTRFTKDKTPSTDDLTELKSLYDDLKGSLSNTTASTTGLMVAVCTAALGSARSIVVY